MRRKLCLRTGRLVPSSVSEMAWSILTKESRKARILTFLIRRKSAKNLAIYPTFSPDEITYDESISEDDFEDDTLVDDTTGHGVDLEDGLFDEGLWVAFELLDMDPSEWSMHPWGYEMLYGIEVLLAAGGHPSRSRQLGRLRTWSRKVSYEVDAQMASNFVERIDYYMAEVRADPIGKGIYPDAMDQVEAEAEKMLNRIAKLL